MARQKQQRTLEEALAGRPARQYFVNKSEEQVINPRTGRKCAPAAKKPRPRWTNSWFCKIKPDHPEYDPELAKKHFLMIQENGRKGAARRASTPKGYRWKDWKVIWEERKARACAYVQKMKELGMLDETMTKDDQRAEAALEFAVAVVLSDEFQIKDRLSAAKTVLDFTKAKPIQRVENTIKTAEDFLLSLDVQS